MLRGENYHLLLTQYTLVAVLDLCSACFLISTITVECGLLDRFGTVEHGPLEPYLAFSQSQGPVMGPDSDSSFISFCHVPRRVSWWPFSLATLKLLLPLLNTALPILWLKDETVTSSIFGWCSHGQVPQTTSFCQFHWESLGG